MAQDGLEVGRELDADLLLLIRGKRVDDAVHRTGRASRVQSREYQVAGLGRRDGRLHRLQIAHLANQDHVRVLAQHALERLAEGGHVHADLALVDDALAVLVEVLDGVLHRDDVQTRAPVDYVDHGGQRRGLPRAGRPGDEDQSARDVDQLVHDRRQADLLHRADAVGDQPRHDADRAFLQKQAHAEACVLAEGQREVHPALFVEPLDVLVLGDGTGRFLRVGWRPDG